MPMNRQNRNQRLVALFLLGLLLLNFPLLSIFSKTQLFAGIPLLFLYLFIAWVAIIVTAGLLVERARGADDAPRTRTPGG